MIKERKLTVDEAETWKIHLKDCVNLVLLAEEEVERGKESVVEEHLLNEPDLNNFNAI